ncbi:MAG: hypothetical protein RSC56_02955 [Acidaminococcaceae bacterium]
MLCKKCGFEFVDGLKECPNCQTPATPAEVKVLSADERDTFDGITIEGSKEQEEYQTYSKEERTSSATPQGKVYVKSFGGVSFLWQLLILLLIAGIIFIVLPAFIMIFLAIAAVFFVIRLFQ